MTVNKPNLVRGVVAGVLGAFITWLIMNGNSPLHNFFSETIFSYWSLLHIHLYLLVVILMPRYSFLGEVFFYFLVFVQWFVIGRFGWWIIGKFKGKNKDVLPK